MLNNYYLHDRYIFSIIFPSPCCLEKTFFCLWRRGTRSMTGLKKVTWGKHTYMKTAHTHFAFKHGTRTNEPFKCNISKKHFQHRCVWQCVCVCACVWAGVQVHIWISLCVFIALAKTDFMDASSVSNCCVWLPLIFLILCVCVCVYITSASSSPWGSSSSWTLCFWLSRNSSSFTYFKAHKER